MNDEQYQKFKEEFVAATRQRNETAFLFETSRKTLFRSAFAGGMVLVAAVAVIIYSLLPTPMPKTIIRDVQLPPPPPVVREVIREVPAPVREPVREPASPPLRRSATLNYGDPCPAHPDFMWVDDTIGCLPRVNTQITPKPCPGYPNLVMYDSFGCEPRR